MNVAGQQTGMAKWKRMWRDSYDKVEIDVAVQVWLRGHGSGWIVGWIQLGCCSVRRDVAG
jgi:hypothetical protein